MKKLFIICICIAALVSVPGCLAMSAGYCKGKEFEKKSVPPSKKYPITFSVSVVNVPFAVVGHGKTQEDIEEKIEKALISTGLFSSVHYSAAPPPNSYHLNFNVWHSGTSRRDAVGVAMISGFTLALIPVGEDFTLDIGANLMLRGKNIASFGQAERARQIVWLPFILFLPSVIICAETAYSDVVDAVVNDIATYHYNRFVLGRE